MGPAKVLVSQLLPVCSPFQKASGLIREELAALLDITTLCFLHHIFLACVLFQPQLPWTIPCKLSCMSPQGGCSLPQDLPQYLRILLGPAWKYKGPPSVSGRLNPVDRCSSLLFVG